MCKLFHPEAIIKIEVRMNPDKTLTAEELQRLFKQIPNMFCGKGHSVMRVVKITEDARAKLDCFQLTHELLKAVTLAEVTVYEDHAEQILKELATLLQSEGYVVREVNGHVLFHSERRFFRPSAT